MNDIYGLQASGLPPELAAKLSGLTRQQQIAEAMMKQGMAPVENVGGPGSRIHWTQGLAKVLNAYLGAKGMKDASTGMSDLAGEKQRLVADKLAQFQQKLSGTPAQAPLTPNDDEGNPMPGIPAQPGGMNEALAYGGQEPLVQKSPQYAAVLKAWEKAQEPYSLAGDAKRYVGGKEVASNPKPPKADAPHVTVLGVKMPDGSPGEQRAQWNPDTKKYDPIGEPTPKFNPKGDSERPFYTFIGTPEGIVSGNARTGEVRPVNLPGGTQPVKSADSPDLQGKIAGAKEVAKDTGASNVKFHESAIAAGDNIQKIDQLINHLKSSDAITGMGAETLKNIERAKALVTASQAAGKKVSDTEIADVMMGSEVFPMIQQLGIGARGMDTPAEREFMRNVLTGTVSLNKDTLLRMAQIRRDVAARIIQRFNDRVDKGELDDYFSASKRTKGKVSAPVDANVPTATGPDGKKLYLRNGQWVPQ